MRQLLKIYSQIDKSLFLYGGVLLLLTSHPYLSVISFLLWSVKYFIMFDNVNPRKKSEYTSMETRYAVFHRKDIDTIVLKPSLTPYEKGVAQGELMADKMRVFFRKIRWILWLLGCDAYKIPDQFPSAYREELRGLVDGYNSRSSDKITLEFAYKYHCLPDASTWLGTHSLLRSIFSAGCTVIIRGQTVGRTLDFCPFGTGGSDTFILEDGCMKRVLVPGIIGCITGWNKKTFVALNISYSNGRNLCGWPMLFACRAVLESGDFDYPNASSFHVTVSDGSMNRRLSFGQGQNNAKHNTWYDEITMCTLNFNYGLFDADKNTAGSLSRQKVINAHPWINMHDLLRHPLINVHDTINSIVYDFETGKIFIRRNNSFASDEEEQVELEV